MSVYKLCYKFLSSPNNDTATYEIEAPEGAKAMRHQIEFGIEGEYEVEYWAIDDAGNVSEKKTRKVMARQYKAPKPPIGGVLCPKNVTEDLKEFCVTKANVSIFFDKKVDGFGFAFDWSLLDLSGLKISQNVLDFDASSWLYKYLIEHNMQLKVEMVVMKGKKLFVTINNCDYSVFEDAAHLVSKYVANYRFENGRLAFDLLKPAKFEWR